MIPTRPAVMATLALSAALTYSLPSAAAPGKAEDSPLPSIYGIQLGAKAEYRECPYLWDKYMNRNVYSGDITTPCYRQLGMDPAGPPPSDVMAIHFPNDERPRLSSSGGILLHLVDGRIERISFSTRGVEDQIEVAKALAEKFGPPTKSVQEKIQVPSGAKYKALVANWSKLGYTVKFQAVGDSIKFGSVAISTPKGEEVFRLRNERALRDKRPL
jgi:hypothetical protein